MSISDIFQVLLWLALIGAGLWLIETIAVLLITAGTPRDPNEERRQ